MSGTDPQSPIRVVLVEDDPESGEAMQSSLRRKGIEAAWVTTGESAIGSMAVELPDAVISDIRLEGGMDGVELLRRIRESRPDLPVILVTAYDSLGSAIEAVKLGAQDYILKPLDDIEDLVLPLRKAVGHYRLQLRNRALELEIKENEGKMRALAARLDAVREEERARIAREIHDELGHTLTAALMELSWLSKKAERSVDEDLCKSAAEKIPVVRALLGEAIEMGRRVATELRPALLDHLGIGAAVDWQVAEFAKRTKIACRLDMPDENIALDPAQATSVFRALQEMLTNVTRHAHANSVNVRFVRSDGNVVLEVRDDGKGMPAGQVVGAESLGIIGMRERARLLGGDLSITSEPGKGTTVALTVRGRQE